MHLTSDVCPYENISAGLSLTCLDTPSHTVEAKLLSHPSSFLLWRLVHPFGFLFFQGGKFNEWRNLYGRVVCNTGPESFKSEKEESRASKQLRDNTRPEKRNAGMPNFTDSDYGHGRWSNSTSTPYSGKVSGSLPPFSHQATRNDIYPSTFSGHESNPSSVQNLASYRFRDCQVKGTLGRPVQFGAQNY